MNTITAKTVTPAQVEADLTMFDPETVNALRNAAKLLEEAASVIEDAEDNDPLEYANECVARALAALLSADYDMDYMLKYARDVA